MERDRSLDSVTLVHDTHTQPTSWSIGKVKLWLKRSKDHELFLKILDTNRSELDPGKHIFSEILSREIHCWRDIHFTLHPTTHPSLASIPSGAATALQSAYLLFNVSDHSVTDSIWQTILSSPSLLRVKWETLRRAGWEYLEIVPFNLP